MEAKPTERKEVTSASPRHVAFEPLALVLLSLATVGTAWCSYQAAAWGGVSQRLSNLSAATGRQAASAQLQYHQIGLLDVLLFSQYMNAYANSNQVLARFYSDRFRGEAKSAFTRWLETHPFENKDAPAHPFVSDLYKPALLSQAKEAEEQSQELWLEAGAAGRTSRTYVLNTVLLASALFFGGTASRFDGVWVRRVVLLLGLSLFALVAAGLTMLPVQL
jgi:hypothetical protein